MSIVASVHWRRLLRCRMVSVNSSALLTLPRFTSSAVSVPVSVPAFSAERNAFLFGDNPRSFRSLKLNEQLCIGLEATGKETATVIQASAFDLILERKNVVVSAETGTGKTFAYLLPLLHMMLEDPSTSEGIHPVAVIVVPNKELGNQVYEMGHELLTKFPGNTGGRSIIGASWNLENEGDVFNQRRPSPGILICTPRYLSKQVKGPHILDERLFESIKHIVLDEADLLLEGDFVKQIEQIMETFKNLRRRHMREGNVKVHEDTLQKILSAATIPTNGAKSIRNYLEYNFGHLTEVTNESVHKHHPRISQTFIDVTKEDTPDMIAPIRPIAYVDSIVEAIYDFAAETNNASSGESRPMFTKFEMSIGDKASAAPPTPSSSDIDLPLTIVFVNTARHAVELTEALQGRHVPCGQYHKLLRSSEKTDALEKFKKGELPVLVATDVAARLLLLLLLLIIMIAYDYPSLMFDTYNII
jgi:superfamily II DNA/RNA helicase